MANPIATAFLDWFSWAGLFTKLQRPGAPTQLFADENSDYAYAADLIKPLPARPGDNVSPVHPTILVRLPRFGDQVGLIPNTPAGRLLYGWLAAFNQASYPALGNALPNVAPTSAAAAQIEFRKQTGGFNLLSAKEVQPGVLVFRLRDQTPSAIEALGTLQVRPNSNPAAIASFSLRAVPPYRQDATKGAAPLSPDSPR
jgi:hypothetical protein